MQAVKDANIPAEAKLLSAKSVAKALDLGTSTLFEWLRDEKKTGSTRFNFPKPRKIGNLTRWRADEIRQWVATLEEFDALAQSRDRDSNGRLQSRAE